MSGAESVDFDDPDGLGGVGVDDVTIDDRGMTVTSCYVGSFTTVGAHSVCSAGWLMNCLPPAGWLPNEVLPAE